MVWRSFSATAINNFLGQGVLELIFLFRLGRSPQQAEVLQFHEEPVDDLGVPGDSLENLVGYGSPDDRSFLEQVFACRSRGLCGRNDRVDGGRNLGFTDGR